MKKIRIQHTHPALAAVAVYANEGKDVIQVKKGKKVTYYHSISAYIKLNGVPPSKYERRDFPFVENGYEFKKIPWNEI